MPFDVGEYLSKAMDVSSIGESWCMDPFTKKDGPDVPPSDNRVKSPLSEPEVQMHNTGHRPKNREGGRQGNLKWFFPFLAASVPSLLSSGPVLRFLCVSLPAFGCWVLAFLCFALGGWPSVCARRGRFRCVAGRLCGSCAWCCCRPVVALCRLALTVWALPLALCFFFF